MEKENPGNDKKSEQVEEQAQYQIPKDKDDKDFGKEASNIKLKTEDGVQQTETVTVQEENSVFKAMALPCYPGAVVENPGPDNCEIMKVLENIQQQLNALTTTVANIQRDAVLARQPAIRPPPPDPLAIAGPSLPLSGDQSQQFQGDEEWAILLPLAEQLATGPPPVGNRPSSASASGGLSIQPSQARDPIHVNRLADASASGGVCIQAAASISGNLPALSNSCNVDSFVEQSQEVQRPSGISPLVSSVRSAAHRRFNRDRCNPF
uniref:uncharacterized protein LOC120336615 n=1 Tax=Styela clava TaxID=7725 RepID=UPI001939B210|nr:uncharacterized protein LOC120336615 [Styela clava]